MSSINAPDRFLNDPRNKLFKQFERFVEEFEPKTFVFENVPGLMSMDDGNVFRQIVKIFGDLGYHVSAKILFAAHYGAPQERWRLILLGSRLGNISHPEPTHFAVGRANFRGGNTMTYQLAQDDRQRLLPTVTVGDAIGDLPRLEMGEGAEVLGYTKDAHSLRNHEKSFRGDVQSFRSQVVQTKR
jgi:DNA (cytosine-5)-methyltransferase 1